MFRLEVLEKYVQKMELDAIAITNHNIFDMGNYMAIKDRLPNCTVLPGIEVDLEGGHILVISNPDDVELYDFSIRCDSVSRKITSPEDTLRLNEFYTIFPNLSKYLLIPHYDKKPYIPKNIISALSDYIFAGEVTSVKKFHWN